MTVLGTRLLRKEDPPLVTGEARFVDDLDATGALWMAVVRSTMAHGRLRSVDLSAARSMPGVVAAFTGDDMAPDFAAPLPCAWPVTDDMKNPPHRPLATGKVCFAGEPVAVVVADTRYQAADAAEAVVVDYEPLEAVLDVEEAATDRVVIHDDAGTNVSYTWSLTPDEAAVEAAFASAAHSVSERYVQQRLIPSAMEPRGVVVLPAPFSGDFTVYSATQVPHILRVMLSLTTGVPEHRLRVVAPSVGGGFGSKLDVYPEEVLCLALARRLRRPVRWTEGRSENAVATIHGRGQVQQIELAADSSARITAVRVRLVADMGAYLHLVSPGVPLLGAFLYHGVYDVPAYSFTCTGVFTNKTPTDAYRGAGRPEATYAIERAIDSLARRAGLDPAEVRRRNFIPKEAFPYSSAGGLTFDSGDYARAFDKALELAGYDAARAEQATAAAGRVRVGVGISSYVEMCGLAPSRVLASLKYAAGGWEAATVRMLPTGRVEVVTGTSPHGQGHETSWSMIVADRLGVDPGDVDVLHSDTALAPAGMDTYGSRSLSVGGTAIALAAEKVVEKARAIAAHELEAAVEDVEFVDGSFRVVGTPARTVPLGAVAFSAFTAHDLPEGVEPGLAESVTFDPVNFTFPFGTHVCVVEVDTATGQVRIRRYVAVDDCGNQVNPLIVDGQLQGGIVQGIAQALFEGASYDAEGNLRSATLADYLVPSAADVPSLVLERTVTPSPSNPLGVKGVGEAGTIAATPAVVNAVVDALGVRDIEMPLTAERVWRAARSVAESAGGPGASPAEEVAR